MGTPLNNDALAAALADLPGWTGDTNALARTAELPSFPAAIAVVDKVAVVAEEINHHPDIDIRWTKLDFHLSSYDTGNRVTVRDVELAHRIEAIISSAS